MSLRRWLHKKSAKPLMPKFSSMSAPQRISAASTARCGIFTSPACQLSGNAAGKKMDHGICVQIQNALDVHNHPQKLMKLAD